MTLETFVTNMFAEPLGVAWPDLVLILMLALGLLFFAMGLRSGLIMLWAFLGIGYMIYSSIGMDTFHILTLFIVIGVLMVVSLFVSHSHAKSGVVGL